MENPHIDDELLYIIETSVEGSLNSRDLANRYGDRGSRWWAMSDSSPWRLLQVRGRNVLWVIAGLKKLNVVFRVKDYESALELPGFSYDPKNGTL